MGFMEDTLDEGVAIQRKELGLCDEVIEQVRDELYRATRKHGAMKSGHEGYAVILEEMDELWYEIKHGTKAKARKEAIQVAAMAIRLVANLYSKIQNV